jgi:hypothetical protein
MGVLKKKIHASQLGKCLLFLVGIASFAMMAIPIWKGAFFFTFDQARDALWVKNQIDFRQLSLIGPVGSLNGVFFGPLWLWLLIIPALLSGGDPTILTLFNAIFTYATLLFAAFLIRKHDKYTAYFFLLLGFISLSISNISATAFSQHLLFLFTFIYIYSLSSLQELSQPKYAYIAAFSASLMFHAEPPVFLFSLPSWLILVYLAHRKHPFISFKMLIFSGIFFVLPFLPSLLFDLKHNFLQFKSILAYLHGKNNSLGDILPFGQRIGDRFFKFFTIFQNATINNSLFAFIILLLVLFFVRHHLNKFIQIIWKVSSVYILTLLVILIIFPPELKLFYLDGLSMIFILLVATVIAKIWKKNIYSKICISLVLVIAFIINKQPVKFIRSMGVQFTDYQKDTSIFRTQKAVVDWIYDDAQGGGFKVYTYQPAVYDYPYQYLFFWYGVNQFGYLPADFSYLPDQPEYVQKKSEQLVRLKEKIKPAADYFYLIIEPGFYEDRMQSWMKNFSENQYPLIKSIQFPDHTRIEKRQGAKNL